MIVVLLIASCFFFSSRRRHTRFDCDWSSDVCSSDLMTVGHDVVRDLRASVAAGRLRVGFAPIPHRAGVPPATVLYASAYAVPARALRRKAAVELAADLTEIGRASCRERGEISGVAGSL